MRRAALMSWLLVEESATAPCPLLMSVLYAVAEGSSVASFELKRRPTAVRRSSPPRRPEFDLPFEWALL